MFGSCRLGIFTLEMGMAVDLFTGALHTIDSAPPNVSREPIHPSGNRIRLQGLTGDRHGSPRISFRQTDGTDGPGFRMSQPTKSMREHQG